LSTIDLIQFVTVNNEWSVKIVPERKVTPDNKEKMHAILAHKTLSVIALHSRKIYRAVNLGQ